MCVHVHTPTQASVQPKLNFCGEHIPQHRHIILIIMVVKKVQT